MHITKLGHCCLLIKDKGLTILTDPGVFSAEQNFITGVDVLLITHEHQDHYHIDSVKAIVQNNPEIKVVTNTAVGKLLDEHGIKYELLEHGDSKMFGEVLVEGFGKEHAEIYPTIPRVQNTGFLVANTLFFPGDAFTIPNKTVEVLALPVAGPWMHMRECIDYAKEVHPKKVFPVHDGFLKMPGPFYLMPKMLLEPSGIEFVTPDGQTPMSF